MSALRDDRVKFAAANTVVYGVNPGSIESHREWATELGLGFPLIADTEREVARTFDALKEDGQAIERTVVIIGPDGVIRYLERGLPSNDDLLAAIGA